MDFELIVKFLTGRLNDREQYEILRKIDSDSDFKKQFELTKKIWDKSAGLNNFDNINTDTDWEFVRSSLRPKFKLRSKRLPVKAFIFRAAIIIVIALGLVYSLHKISSVFSKTEYISILCDSVIQEVTLPDGSMITLNKNSTVSYNKQFNNKNRELFFSGEACFDVIINTRLPFVIRINNSTIQVVGTRFNIREDTTSVKVTVVSGKISLYETKNRNNHVELIKNQTASFEYASKKIIYGQNNNLNFLAWKTGRFEFVKTPAVDVLTIIADYFNKRLVLKIPVSDSITGIFENQPLDEILREIELTSSIKIENNQDYIIVRK